MLYQFTISYLLVRGVSGLARSIHESFNQTAEIIKETEDYIYSWTNQK